MKSIFRRLSRAAYSTLALALAMTAVLPGIVNAYSGGQVTSRSIEMSSSVPSALSVNYTVTFTPVTTEASGSIIVDFCSNSPIPGDTCTATAGTDVPDTTSVSRVSGATGTVSTITGNHTVKIDTTALTSGTAYTIELGGIKNPSNTATFYARIFTYANATGAGSADDYVAGSTPTEGSVVDYGGDALSTATTINITAKVMEQITFCVSGSSITNCGTTTAPTITLGNASGVLDTSGVYTANVFTQTSTNAQTGVKVRMKDTSSTACGGLSSDGGTTCGIPGIGATAGTITAGTADFGMCVTPGSANTTATTPYNNSGCTQYGLDNTNVTSTYGSEIFSSTGTLSQENDTLKFAATAGSTTPAGIYTTNDSLIATGTY